MNFGLIIIGDEILSGKRQDKHMPKVIELLKARGLRLAFAEYHGDDRARLVATYRRTFAEAQSGQWCIFSCGGIGATPDDHTRQAAAEALSVPLQLHPGAEVHIRARAVEMKWELTPQRLAMGEFPAGSDIIPNPYNKIAGFAIGHHWFVPGFPVMAWPMIEWVLDTHYQALHGGGAQHEKSVIVFGAMEATLTPLMESIETAFAGIKVFSLPSVDHPTWGRHIELGVKGQDQEQIATAYQQMLAGLRALGAQLGPEMVR